MAKKVCIILASVLQMILATYGFVMGTFSVFASFLAYQIIPGFEIFFLIGRLITFVGGLFLMVFSAAQIVCASFLLHNTRKGKKTKGWLITLLVFAALAGLSSLMALSVHRGIFEIAWFFINFALFVMIIVALCLRSQVALQKENKVLAPSLATEFERAVKRLKQALADGVVDKKNYEEKLQELIITETNRIK